MKESQLKKSKMGTKEQVTALSKITCPLDPGIGRVAVILLKEEEPETSIVDMGGSNRKVIQHGNIVLLEESKDIVKENETDLGIIKALGVSSFLNKSTRISVGFSPFLINDLVYVFPNVVETKITVEGITYLIFNEMDIISRLK